MFWRIRFLGHCRVLLNGPAIPGAMGKEVRNPAEAHSKSLLITEDSPTNNTRKGSQEERGKKGKLRIGLTSITTKLNASQNKADRAKAKELSTVKTDTSGNSPLVETFSDTYTISFRSRDWRA
jgi:hypothetical protein